MVFVAVTTTGVTTIGVTAMVGTLFGCHRNTRYYQLDTMRLLLVAILRFVAVASVTMIR